MVDIQDYHRRLKLQPISKPLPFTPNSNWTPKLSALPPSIRPLIRADTYATKNFNWRVKDKSNLSTEEAQVLNQLKRNNHIIIKPADKASAVVILDRDRYIWEAKRQLYSSNHDRILQNPIFHNTIPMVTEIRCVQRDFFKPQTKNVSPREHKSMPKAILFTTQNS